MTGDRADAATSRRFLADELSAWGCEALLDDAAVCVAELVANAVMHTVSAIEVVLRWQPPTLRVEVRDESPEPAIGVKTLSLLAESNGELWTPGDTMSGRGLAIVASLASALGEVVDRDGKVVWFELNGEPGHAPTQQDGAVPPIVQETVPQPLAPGTATVHLLRIPVAVAIAADAHLDDLTRELKVTEGSSLALALLSALDWLGGFPYDAQARGAVQLAAKYGRPTLDVTTAVPEDAGAVVGHMLNLLGAAGEAMEDGLLLTVPAARRVSQFLAWCGEEIVKQLDGGAPTPFTPH